LDKSRRYRTSPAGREQKRQWRLNNPESVKASKKRDYLKRKKAIREQQKRWAARNPNHLPRYFRNYFKRRYAEDPQFAAAIKYRAWLYQSLSDKLRGKRNPWMDKLVGCPFPDFVKHIEKQFLPGMSWANRGRGKGKWQVDHIIQLSSFDCLDPEQRAKAFHYTNLRPRWVADHKKKTAADNLKKGMKTV
jgi:hypothetical protein